VLLKIANEQGGFVEELIDDVDKTIDSEVNTEALHVGRWSSGAVIAI
jgi:hypothetical protein